MKIQRTSNTITQQSKNNVNFKAIYAADWAYSSDLGALIKSTNSKRGKSCREIIKSYLGADLIEKYDSLLFNKNISATCYNRPIGDIFLNRKEERLVRNYNKKILSAVQNENNEDIINKRLLLFEELKSIIEKAKPVSTRKILGNTKRLELVVKQANTKAVNNLFKN